MQPQQSHDSPHLGAGVGLTMEVMEEAAEPGIMMKVVGSDARRKSAPHLQQHGQRVAYRTVRVIWALKLILWGF